RKTSRQRITQWNDCFQTKIDFASQAHMSRIAASKRQSELKIQSQIADVRHGRAVYKPVITIRQQI
ncbi:MAG: hypothetical protein WC298_08105, partial [Sideroxydans sp.]